MAVETEGSKGDYCRASCLVYKEDAHSTVERGLRAVDAEAFALGRIVFAPRDELQGIGNTVFWAS